MADDAWVQWRLARSEARRHGAASMWMLIGEVGRGALSAPNAHRRACPMHVLRRPRGRGAPEQKIHDRSIRLLSLAHLGVGLRCLCHLQRQRCGVVFVGVPS
eukprot:1588649-Amphidinium_carterae.1